MQSAGNALQSLLQRLGLDRQFRTYEALARWSDIVGKQIAQVARPVRVDADTLWVAVKSHAWAQELNFQKGTILRRLNERAGEERFKELRFTVRASLPTGVVVGGDADATGRGNPVGGDADATRSSPFVASASPPTLSEAELAQVESSLAGVSNPVLRGALRRAQIASLRTQKYLAQRGWRRCVVCECYHSDDSAVCFLCEQGV
ncbi:MAG: DUF721 domain-containing protein [Fimbriimonadales bacterium]|nr:DUF721 domain-containing protein [Fimbriimonadales bacterium]